MRFLRGEGGSVTMITALGGLALVAVAAAAIDVGRMVYVKDSLQTAADAATLAAGRVPRTTDKTQAQFEGQLVTTAQAAFDANFRLSSSIAKVQPLKLTYIPKVGTTPDMVSVEGSALVPMSFAKLVGLKESPISFMAKAQRPQPGPIDLALVLDTTSSMGSAPAAGGEPKVTTLKSAATALVNQVMATGSPSIQVGVVPYAAYVNVGLRNPVPDWVLPIERDYCSSLTYENPNAACTTWKYDCLVDGVMKPAACTGTDCSARGKQSCAAISRSPWGGCIGSRTVLSNNPANIVANPTTEAFLDKISSPTSPKYSGQSMVSTVNNALCPQPIVGLTSNATSVLNSIAGLKVTGDTSIPMGLIWGWNVLAPGEPYEARTKAQLDAIGGRKVLLLMTDGINATSPRLYDGPNLANGSTSLSLPWRDGTKSNALIPQICTNIKAEGIQIFTVLFDVTDANIRKTLEDCATDKTTMSFSASDRQGLLEAFAKISDKLMTLKLVE